MNARNITTVTPDRSPGAAGSDRVPDSRRRRPMSATPENTESTFDRWTTITQRFCEGSLSESELESWRSDQLVRVLHHMKERSVMYRTRLAEVDAGRVRVQSLPSLPFTTKADLREWGWDALCGGPADALVYYETTGTTGPSTPCPRSTLDVQHSNAHIAAAWRRTLSDTTSWVERPVVALMGPAELYAFADTFSAVCHELEICHVKLWPESPRVGYRKALQLLRDLEVSVVVCPPAVCLNLAKAALQHGYDLARDFRIKAFFVLGEVCTPQFAANVRSLWGADVLPALYGSQECYAIAFGCSEGRLHMAETNFVTEVLDPSDQTSVGTSGTGELVLTMLLDGIKPLLRYRTGDLVSLGEQICSCGSPGRLVSVLGRLDDGLTLNGEEWSPAQLESAVLADVTGCLGYQLVVDTCEGKDSLVVRLAVTTRSPELIADLCDGVCARLAPTGALVRVEIVDDLDPITCTGAYVSWKAARIEDLRHRDDDSKRAARRSAALHDVSR